MRQLAHFIFIHGWGLGPLIWQDFVEGYFSAYEVYCPNIFQYPCVDSLLSDLAGRLGKDTVIIAWSMGGLIGIELARRYRQRIRSLVLLNSSPYFLSADRWPQGITPGQIGDLSARMRVDPTQALRYFCGLVSTGAIRPRQQIRYLDNILARQAADSTALLAWLHRLAYMDLRETFAALSLPIQLVLGDRDSLVNVDIGKALVALNPLSEFEVLKGTGHASFLSDPRHCVRLIHQAIE